MFIAVFASHFRQMSRLTVYSPRVLTKQSAAAIVFDVIGKNLFRRSGMFQF